MVALLDSNSGWGKEFNERPSLAACLGMLPWIGDTKAYGPFWYI